MLSPIRISWRQYVSWKFTDISHSTEKLSANWLLLKTLLWYITWSFHTSTVHTLPLAHCVARGNKFQFPFLPTTLISRKFKKIWSSPWKASLPLCLVRQSETAQRRLSYTYSLSLSLSLSARLYIYISYYGFETDFNGAQAHAATILSTLRYIIDPFSNCYNQEINSIFSWQL